MLILLALVSLLSYVSTISITRGQLVTGAIDGGQGNTIRIGAAMLFFDEKVYLKLSNTSIVPVTSIAGISNQFGQRSPASLFYGGTSVSMTCNSTNFVTIKALPQDASLMGKLIVAPPAADPVSAVSDGFNGVVLDKSYIDNLFSFGFLISQTNPAITTISNMELGNCTVYIRTSLTPSAYPGGIQNDTFNQTPNNPYTGIQTGMLCDVNGNPLTQTSFKLEPPIPNKCSAIKYRDAVAAYNQYVGALLDVVSEDSLNQVVNILDNIAQRSAFQDCIKLIGTFYSISYVPTVVGSTTQCPYRWNTSDPQWLAEPCCNWQLNYDQCCLPKQVSVLIPSFGSVNSSAIATTCQNPDTIIQALNDIIPVLVQQATLRSVDRNDLIQGYVKVFDTCNSYIGTQSCTVDTDCYTGSCGDSNTCTVLYGKEDIAMLKCFIAQSSDDMVNALAHKWNINIRHLSDSQIFDAFYAYVQQNLYVPNCVGPNGYQYAASITWSQLADGTWGPVFVPANQTGCLAEKQCNWNQQYPPVNETECLSGEPKVCIRDFGYWVNVMTVLPRCGTWGLNSTQCDAINGTSQNGMCFVESSSLLNCSRYNDYFTRYLTGPYRGLENSQVCFTTNINQTACQGTQGMGWPMFIQATNTCVTWTDVDTCSQNPGWQYYVGLQYMPGRYFTQDQCTTVCDVQDYNLQQLPPSQCTSISSCNYQCPQCTGQNQNNVNSVCVITPGNSTTCEALGGGTENNVLQGVSSSCVLNVFGNASACAAANGVFYSCSANNQTTCSTAAGTADAQGYLNCQWNQWAFCSTQASCQAAGQCNDWEFQNYNCSNGPCVSTGVCARFYTYNATNPGNPCNQNEFQGQYTCRLTDNTIDQAACLNNHPGYQWFTRATTPAECAAHGSGCREPNFWQLTTKNNTYCNQCGGNVQPKFTWSYGQWTQNKVAQLSWVTKNMTSKNKFYNSFFQQGFRNEIQNVASRLVGRLIYANTNKLNTLIYNTMQAIVCDCTGGSSCFGSSVVSPVDSCLTSGSESATCGSVTTSNTTFNGTSTVTINSVGAAYFAHRGVQRDANNPYAVITYNNVVVGQLIGSGQQVTSSGSITGSFQLCLTVNPSISIDNVTYPVPDFSFSNSATSTGSPMGITVTKDGLTYCGTVSNQGYYYPIFRTADYLSAGSNGGGNSGGSSGSGGSQSGFASKADFSMLIIALSTIMAMIFSM